MKNIAYIGMGSNLGDRSNLLFQAVKSLNEHSQIEVLSTSSIYETAPVGFLEQDLFLNMVIKVKTGLSPVDLLRVNQNIEEEFGRKRSIRWGPRTLDLDILLYNHENIETEMLEIPHPRMTERAFVLIPLLEIDHTIELPISRISLSSLVAGLQDKEGVRIWKQKSGEDVYELFEN